jgi:hypothetical protein
MAVRTSSSSAPRPSVRGSARTALLFGLLGVLSLPVAILIAYETDWWSYLESTWAAVPAAVLGLLAVITGGRAKVNASRSVLPVEGAGAARWGRRLGWLSIYFAAMAGLSLAVYAYETYLSG